MPFVSDFPELVFPLLLVLVALTLVLKGYALWYAARGNQRSWFIALLFINTLGILEIAYLLFFRPGAPYARVVEPKKAPPAPPGA